MSSKLNNISKRIIDMGREDPKSLEAMGLKVMEEVGEWAENVNHSLGNLPHKEMKEDLFGESADVIQCVMASLAKAYPYFSTEMILERLTERLITKTDKWEKVRRLS